MCLGTGRFVVLKDVSCDMKIIRRRIALAAGTSLSLVNANAAIALEAINAGSSGFCGVFTNFHPDLYAWLYQSASEDTDLLRELASFLVLSALAENLGYPAIAKRFHRRLGTFASANCRAVEYDITERFWGVDPILDIIETTGQVFRKRIERLQKISATPDRRKQAPSVTSARRPRGSSRSRFHPNAACLRCCRRLRFPLSRSHSTLGSARFSVDLEYVLRSQKRRVPAMRLSNATTTNVPPQIERARN